MRTLAELSELSELEETTALIIRSDFTDEAAWREVITELEAGSFYECAPSETYEVVHAPELNGADADAVRAAIEAQDVLRDLSVAFVADSTTMSTAHRALLAVSTDEEDEDEAEEGDWDDEDEEDAAYEEPERAREFRTVPGGVHIIHANLALANADFGEYALSASLEPDGAYRSDVTF